MMTPSLIWLGVGLTIGLLTGMLVVRLKYTNTISKITTDYSVLSERLIHKEGLIQGLEEALSEKKTTQESLHTQVNQGLEQLAALKAQLEASKDMLKTEQERANLFKSQLSESFKALASEALHQNNHQFMKLAQGSFEKFSENTKGNFEKQKQAVDHLLKPVQGSLERMDHYLKEVEKARVGSYEALNQQVKHLSVANTDLRKETHQLTQALRTPIVRGRWGEMQLKRVVELAGMVDRCDFYEQTSQNSEEGRLRPDMIVRLPGEKQIVVDAKTPLHAFLEAADLTEDSQKQEKLEDFVRHVRTHILTLSKKAYWNQFQPTPDFVVLFLPGESFFSAALQQDPTLIEVGAENRIILATPTTLLSLLKAVAYGWQQESIAKHAQCISDLGQELYKRIGDLTDHFLKLGRSLGQSVDAYNKAIGTLETRVLVSARKFQALGVSAGKDLEHETPEPIDKAVRKTQAPELAVPAPGSSLEV